MKKLIAVLIMTMALSLVACGSGPESPQEPEAGVIAITGLDINNTLGMDAVSEQAGIWNAGETSLRDTSYISVEVTNNLLINATVFPRVPWEVVGCAGYDFDTAGEAVELAPGESVEWQAVVDPYRCGLPAYNQSLATVYNAAGFNPGDYASALDYPVNAPLINATVIWRYLP